jgi:UDP-N-acetylmuramoylalanine-D-glutamate ligase
MVHVLVVGAIEEAELLLAVRWIVGGIDVQQDFAALADLLAAKTNELIE